MLLQDLRYAFRSLRSAPAFTVVAVLSLAIGIGANTAIFSVASALIMRPLPYQDADRLVILWNRSPGLGITEDWFSTAQYFDIKTAHGGFEQIAIAIGANYNLTGDGEPERIGTIRVSSNLLPMLGARAHVGRLFASEEDLPGHATAILGYGTWMRRYGGDPNVVGRSLTLNGQGYQIVGVLPEWFSLPREVMPTLGNAENSEILLPLPLPPNAATIRNREDYNLLGKLRPGVSAAQAQLEMDAITARLRREHPEVYPSNGGLTFSIVPLQEQVVGSVRRPLWILTGAVLAVLLIACANVANLLLSRGVGRQREIAVRSALGASAARIIRQLLTESVLLALAGGVAGCVVAAVAVRAIHALGARSVPRLHEVGIDVEVLFFAFVISLVSGVLFGLVPAMRLTRVDLQTHLKDAARGAGAGAMWGRGHYLRRLLVVSELALSVMLLVAAGLLIRSFARLQQVPPGFDSSNVLTLELTMSGRKYADANAVLETYRELWRRLRTLPGVTGTGGVSALPLSQMMAWGPITVEGRVAPPGQPFINVDQRTVAGDYFSAMRIPLLAGRLFTEQDTRSTPRVIVVDEHMASRLWPNEDPVGKRVRTGGMDASPDAPWMTVVGVVGRVKQDALDSDPRMAMYRAHAQVTSRAMNVVIRGGSDPRALAAAATAEIRQVDPDLPVYNVRTMTSRVDESLAQRRFAMLLLAAFAAFAVGLGAIGVYGVMAFVVTQGTRELGIRLALGATSRGVLVLVVRQGLAVALTGLALGLAGALAVTRVMRSLLFEVGATDPFTFGAMALLLLLVALAASYVPAKRAARIDPLASLRSE
jgi:putative ABC transport system permease protein